MYACKAWERDRKKPRKIKSTRGKRRCSITVVIHDLLRPLVCAFYLLFDGGDAPQKHSRQAAGTSRASNRKLMLIGPHKYLFSESKERKYSCADFFAALCARFYPYIFQPLRAGIYMWYAQILAQAPVQYLLHITQQFWWL